MLTLNEFIEKYDTLDAKGYDEYQIASDIWDKNAKGETFYEGLAFEFGEYPDGDGWGNFYGYYDAITLTNGKVYTNIIESDITDSAIKYWQNRISTSISPLFKARYSGLVLDFGKRFEIKPNTKLIQIIINSLIDLIKGNYCSDWNIIKKIGLLIKVASQWTKDQNLKSQAAVAIINYLSFYNKLNNSGIWGIVFEHIIKSDIFTDTQKDKATRIIESHFKEIRDTQNNPWQLEDVANLLIEAYGKKDKRTLPLLKDVETGYKKIAQDVTGFQAQGWLQLVERLYRKYGYNDEADRILSNIANIGKRTLDSLHTFSQTYKIPREKLDAFMASVHNQTLYGTPLENLIMFMVPSEKQAVDSVKELAKKSPLLFMMTTQLLDEKGRPLSNVGPINEFNGEGDLSGQVVLQISKDLKFSAFFLRYGFNELKKENVFNSLIVKNLYKESPIFERERFSLIDFAIIQYFIGNHITFAHLMIPQIENGLRNVLEIVDVSTLKPQKGGKGNTYKTLDAVLREPILEKIMNYDIVNYLRILLTDQRGWNLRNRVCHGMIPPTGFYYAISDRIMHAFLLLCLIRSSNNV